MTDRELLELLLQKVTGMESEVKDIKASQVRMENTMTDMFGGLYDAREVQFDVNERICDSLNRIEGKLDRISLKVSSHDTLLRQVK